MRNVLSAMTLVVLGLLQASGSSAGSEVISRRLGVAHSVLIGYDTGADFTMTPPTDDDRKAAYALRMQFERWGRYMVLDSRGGADLLIAIRVRGVGAGRNRTVTRDGLRFRNESRVDKLDLMSVYDANYQRQGVPLWREVMGEGLSNDGPSLFDKFRRDAESVSRLR